MEVTYHEADASDVTSTRVVVAVKGELLVGFATWDDKSKTLEIVRVGQPFRRKGYATRLIQEADKRAGTTLIDTGERSPEGTALLQSMERRMTRITKRIDPKSCGTTMMFLLQGRHSEGELKFL
jgi:GNAT superfamily N-acetyltransferase